MIQAFDGRQLDRGQVVPCATEAPEARELVGSGAILPGEEVLIVDGDTCQPLASDRIGEIWVRSPSVGQGYWEREEVTRETFEGYTADGAGPYLRTGDLGFLYDGQLYVAGRLKDVIIIRGVNRYPQDIEQTAEQAHDLMQSGLTAAFADTSADRERLVICAEVQKRDASIDWDQVIKAIRRDVSLQHDVPAMRWCWCGMARCQNLQRQIQRHACRDLFVRGSLKVIAQWRAWELDLPAGRADDSRLDLQPAAPADASEEQPVSPARRSPITRFWTSSWTPSGRWRGARQAVGFGHQYRARPGPGQPERMQIALVGADLRRPLSEHVLQEIETVREVAEAIERFMGKNRLRRELVPTETGLKPADSRACRPRNTGSINCPSIGD